MAFEGQKPYQKEVVTGKLYKVSQKSVASGISEQLAPSIQVIGHSIDIYGSQIKEASAPTGMVLEDIDFMGLRAFSLIPNYIYLKDNSGTPTKIIVSGLDIEEVV